MTFPETYPRADRRYLGALKGVSDLKPSGVTVHYTADRDLQRTIRALAARDLAYHLIVDRDGTVYQMVPLTKTVWHAGKATWGSASPNRSHLSISLMSWGEVERLAPGAFETWNGLAIPTADVEDRRGAFWDAATPAQEVALVEALVWACGLGIAVGNICGHDECALPKGRKIDPGGVISKTMEELRAAVAHRLASAV